MKNSEQKMPGLQLHRFGFACFGSSLMSSCNVMNTVPLVIDRSKETSKPPGSLQLANLFILRQFANTAT